MDPIVWGVLIILGILALFMPPPDGFVDDDDNDDDIDYSVK